MSELRARVTTESAVAIAALALLASWVGGAPAGLGVAAAGALTITNFWWLGRGLSSAAASGGHARLVWAVSAGARFVVLLAAFALLFTGGWVHPAAVVAGLTVVPAALVCEGLHAARTTPGS